MPTDISFRYQWAWRRSTYRVDEEKPFGNDSSIEEEGRSSFRLRQEVRSSSSCPPENVESSRSLEDKQSNGLLEEQANNHSAPSRYW